MGRFLDGQPVRPWPPGRPPDPVGGSGSCLVELVRVARDLRSGPATGGLHMRPRRGGRWPTFTGQSVRRPSLRADTARSGTGSSSSERPIVSAVRSPCWRSHPPGAERRHHRAVARRRFGPKCDLAPRRHCGVTGRSGEVRTAAVAAAAVSSKLGVRATRAGPSPRCRRSGCCVSIRRGPEGATTWMTKVEGCCSRRSRASVPRGRVRRPTLLVTENDYSLRLYNGDTGVVDRRSRGSPVAAFERDGEILEVSPSRLAAVDTVLRHDHPQGAGLPVRHGRRPPPRA